MMSFKDFTERYRDQLTLLKLAVIRIPMHLLMHWMHLPMRLYVHQAFVKLYLFTTAKSSAAKRQDKVFMESKHITSYQSFFTRFYTELRSEVLDSLLTNRKLTKPSKSQACFPTSVCLLIEIAPQSCSVQPSTAI